MNNYDVVIIGASASGLMCAIEAGKRGRQVLVLDHATKACKKVLISGGGRCNFTNLEISADNFISKNPHFCKSALSRFSQWDFIAMINAYQIPYHERDHGQLFCDDSARDIRDMLLSECRHNNVSIKLETSIERVAKLTEGFVLETSRGEINSTSLVIASGGLSIPKMGATPFGYKIAEQFGIAVCQPFAGLVPFTLQDKDKSRFAPLSGIAIDSVVSSARKSFRENLLFTHRGLSGPAMLQVSSYWRPGETLHIDLLPDMDLFVALNKLKQEANKLQVKTVLARHLPKRLVTTLIDARLLEQPVAGLSSLQCQQLADAIHDWQIKPNGTEGYRTAEVTVGGVDTNALSSKTMESKAIKGLYFIGEVVDVTGWLGGYNFQWAWSSGWCAGQYV
ncbi:MAG: NAD(P)/FAD-dependent oxidoreductase [Gammaproteobacteria bacterium]